MKIELPGIPAALTEALGTANAALDARRVLEQVQHNAKQQLADAEEVREGIKKAADEAELELALYPSDTTLQKRAEAARKVRAKNTVDMARLASVLAGLGGKFATNDSAIVAADEALEAAKNNYRSEIKSCLDTYIENAAATVAGVLTIVNRLDGALGRMAGPHTFEGYQLARLSSRRAALVNGRFCASDTTADGSEFIDSGIDPGIDAVLRGIVRTSQTVAPHVRRLAKESEATRAAHDTARKTSTPSIVYRSLPSVVPPSPNGPKSAFRKPDPSDPDIIFSERDGDGKIRSYKKVKIAGQDGFEKQYGRQRDGRWYPDDLDAEATGEGASLEAPFAA